MARRLNTANWVKNYLNGMANASTKYKQGIQNVVDNPMVAAADAVDRAVTNYVSAAPRMAAKLRSKPMEAWKNSALTTGADRLASGAKKAEQKVAGYVQAKAAAIQSLMDTVHGMPKGTPEAAKARSAAWIDGMIAIKQQFA